MHCLIPHPAAPAPRHAEVMVTLGRVPAGLQLSYQVRSDELKLPRDIPAGRIDGLWRHTCCELFLSVPGATRYCEFNFSPVGAWAAYDFSGYRVAAGLPDGEPPAISCVARDDGFRLEVVLPLGWLPSAAALQASPTVVLEDTAGRFSYWALRHPGERPDFHHADGFVLTLDPLP